jgi:hypothetical protein
VKTPQRCPNCLCSLRDKTVPAKYRKYRKQFTRALVDADIDPGPGRTAWLCPDCGHQWSTSGIA